MAYDAPMLKATGATVRPSSAGDRATVGLTLTNTGRMPDRLTGVTSTVAKGAAMHRTTHAHGTVPVKSLTVPARDALVLHTGGNDLELTGLKKKLPAGRTVTLHLRFAYSNALTVRAHVEPVSGRSAG